MDEYISEAEKVIAQLRRGVITDYEALTKLVKAAADLVVSVRP